MSRDIIAQSVLTPLNRNGNRSRALYLYGATTGTLLAIVADTDRITGLPEILRHRVRQLYPDQIEVTTRWFRSERKRQEFHYNLAPETVRSILAYLDQIAETPEI